jgi:hypothetical protein
MRLHVKGGYFMGEMSYSEVQGAKCKEDNISGGGDVKE